MYAVFEDGSRQYRVSTGDVIRIDFREGAEKGSSIELTNVLLAANGADVKVGQPTLAGAKVVAEVLGEDSDKLQVQHFRRRKNYRKLKGHRQHYTQIKITAINA
jgi:large subunit ribosomal protein L21